MNNGLLIQGRNVHVFKYIDTSPFEIVCGTDVVFEVQREIIGATTPDSGKYKEFRYRLRSCSCVVSGISTSDNDGDISIFSLLEEDDDIPEDIEIVYTDNNGDERSIRGDFLKETISISGPAEGFSNYEIKFIGSGEFTTNALVDPSVLGENATSDSYTVSGGKIQDNDWIGLSAANIIEVCREGTEQLSMGLPFSFNGTTGEITPDAATTIDGQRMFVIWTF